MGTDFAKAVVRVAQDVALERAHLEIDRSALENPECIHEAGLVVRAYAGRMHGLDWEGTYLWNAYERAWRPKPYVLAATPNGIYDASHTPTIIPADVAQRLDEIVQPLREALTFDPREEKIVEAAKAGAVSQLTLQLLCEIVEGRLTNEAKTALESEAPQPYAPSFGSFG